MFSRLFVVLTILLFGTGLPLAAQTDRSALTGTFQDRLSGRITGAVVLARQIETGWERSTQTSADGIYLIDSLPVGRYTVTVSRPGFRTVHFEDVDQVIGAPEASMCTLR